MNITKNYIYFLLTIFELFSKFKTLQTVDENQNIVVDIEFVYTANDDIGTNRTNICE